MEETNLTNRRQRLERLGDRVDQSISKEIERRFEAPVLEGEAETGVWYRIPIEEGMSGDGSEYHIYIKKGTCDHLCLFFSGGGVAWNEYTAARPVTGGTVAAHLPNYYWNNLRPLTQIMNINSGIMETGNPKNPCNDWNFVVITYATGDFHVGDNDFVYEDEQGKEQVLHFHGLKNFHAAMQRSVKFFPRPDKLLIAGDSAGAFAVPAVTTPILENFYPECDDVTLLSDSAQILYKKWRTTARDVWKTPSAVWEPIHTSNITLDWYRRLYSIWGDRLHYLYAGSTRDYLLSAYYNDVVSHKYTTNALVQEKYYQQMQRMLKELREITPNFHFFIYRWPSFQHPIGGTVHTAVRHKRFYFQNHGPHTMAEWLGDALNGNYYDVNLEFMKKGRKKGAEEDYGYEQGIQI